jgi:uncharacterized protein YijF (DUF1287 family)
LKLPSSQNAFKSGNYSSVVAADFRNSGYLDVFMPNGWVYTRDNDLFFRNNGDGTFTQLTSTNQVGDIVADASPGDLAAAADYDNDGYLDLFVTNPGIGRNEHNLVYHNNGDGTFTRVTLGSLSGDSAESTGCAWGDYDNDGFMDLYVASGGGAEDRGLQNGFLYRNNGTGTFRDVTTRAGLGVETRFVGWGAAIQDLDNDGLPDIFFTTGMVSPELEASLPDAPYKTPNVVFRNLGGGRFEELLEEAGPAMRELHSSRGAAFGDFDNDGDIDILIMNMNEPPSLLRNDTSGPNHWLKVLLEGVESNRSAIGATVVVSYGERRQAQAVLAQSSYLSVNDRRLHFGLGSEEKANLEIRWPNGKVEKLTGVASDRLVVVQEGAGIVRTVSFRR